MQEIEASKYPPALWRPSPNFTRGRRTPIDRIVIHITDGQSRFDRALEHLCAPGGRVSVHFLVGQAGEVAQLVRLGDKAWHAGSWNARSVGIEHIARTPGEWRPADPGLPPTDVQLGASAELVRWLCAQLALPMDEDHILPHCAAPDTTHTDCGLDITKGGIWPWERYWQLLVPNAAT